MSTIKGRKSGSMPGGQNCFLVTVKYFKAMNNISYNFIVWTIYANPFTFSYNCSIDEINLCFPAEIQVLIK